MQLNEWEEILSRVGVWEAWENADGSTTRMMTEIIDAGERTYRETFVRSDGTVTELIGHYVDEEPTREQTEELRAINENLKNGGCYEKEDTSCKNS